MDALPIFCILQLDDIFFVSQWLLCSHHKLTNKIIYSAMVRIPWRRNRSVQIRVKRRRDSAGQSSNRRERGIWRSWAAGRRRAFAPYWLLPMRKETGTARLLVGWRGRGARAGAWTECREEEAMVVASSPVHRAAYEHAASPICISRGKGGEEEGSVENE